MSKTHQEYQEAGYIEDQREFFDKLITQDWDTYLNPVWDRTRQFEVHRILELVGNVPKRVLDVGCGCGYHDWLFAEAGVEQVVGFDYSSKSIEQADHYYPHARVHRVVADIFQANALIGEWGSFDLVVSFQVIEHLKDPPAFLQACAAFTSLDGYVTVVTPHRERLSNRLRGLLGKNPAMVDPMHFAEYSFTELVAMGEQSDLRYRARFGHSISIPHLVIPNSLTIGYALPSLADIIGILFEKMR